MYVCTYVCMYVCMYANVWICMDAVSSTYCPDVANMGHAGAPAWRAYTLNTRPEAQTFHKSSHPSGPTTETHDHPHREDGHYHVGRMVNRRSEIRNGKYRFCGELESL